MRSRVRTTNTFEFEQTLLRMIYEYEYSYVNRCSTGFATDSTFEYVRGIVCSYCWRPRRSRTSELEFCSNERTKQFERLRYFVKIRVGRRTTAASSQQPAGLPTLETRANLARAPQLLAYRTIVARARAGGGRREAKGDRSIDPVLQNAKSKSWFSNFVSFV